MDEIVLDIMKEVDTLKRGLLYISVENNRIIQDLCDKNIDDIEFIENIKANESLKKKTIEYHLGILKELLG